jgi:hypothetical protein
VETVPNKKSRMKKLASYGGAAAVASAGFAGVSVALAAPASAAQGTCGPACYLDLTSPSAGNITYTGVLSLTGQQGTLCNVSLYQGGQVIVGGAISQGPKISCVGFNQQENFDAGAKGGNYSGAWTVGLWQDNNLIGAFTSDYPF